jgi:hypothetical protein
MATAFTPTHIHAGMSQVQPEIVREKKAARRGVLATFVSDLIEDISQKPLQAAKYAKHDMFREHINLMSISYFTLIVLLIASSLPVLAYLISYTSL